MALLDCMLAAQANQNLNYLSTGESPKRMGNAHPSIVPYQVFPVADGHIVIACGNNRQFHNLALALERHDWIDNPIFADNMTRISNRAEVVSQITQQLSTWSKLEVLSSLEAAGVPSGPNQHCGRGSGRSTNLASSNAHCTRRHSRRTHAD